MKLSNMFQVLDTIELPEGGLDFAPVVLLHAVISPAWSDSNKTGFRIQTTADGKQYATGKIEQFKRKLNGSFQDNFIFSCWKPELFAKLEAMSKSDHTYVLVGQSKTTTKEVNGKKQYYKNIIIEFIPEQENL